MTRTCLDHVRPVTALKSTNPAFVAAVVKDLEGSSWPSKKQSFTKIFKKGKRIDVRPRSQAYPSVATGRGGVWPLHATNEGSFTLLLPPFTTPKCPIYSFWWKYIRQEVVALGRMIPTRRYLSDRMTMWGTPSDSTLADLYDGGVHLQLGRWDLEVLDPKLKWRVTFSFIICVAEAWWLWRTTIGRRLWKGVFVELSAPFLRPWPQKVKKRKKNFICECRG